MEPVLRTNNISKGSICAVCFDSISHKNRKRENVHYVKSNEGFIETAKLWREFDHVYSSVFSKHDSLPAPPSEKKLCYHHKCKDFFDERYRKRQPKSAGNDLEMEVDVTQDTTQDAVDISDQPSVSSNSKRVTRSSDVSYETAKDQISCIICKSKKLDKHGKEVPAHSMEMRLKDKDIHQAEEQLIEFAKVHLSRGSKYKDAADRILLQKTTKSLFAGDAGFHSSCYDNFRSPSWKKIPAKATKQSDEKLNELMNLVEYLVIGKKEVYTLAQLRKYYEEGGGSVRSIDIKAKIMERFSGQVSFCKPTQGNDRVTEYLVPSDADILPKAIRVIETGDGITSCLQLKSIARNVSEELQSFPACQWPPTPQAIIESTETVSKILYNFLAWVVSPNSHIGKDGFVKLPAHKATVISQICDNITALAPFSKPTMSQVLISLSIYAKTGSKLIVDDLRRLGTGIPYTETLFILDKWAEWAQKQGSIIPGNIVKNIMTTHVFDNIDWSSRNGRLEIHLTNSILIQKNNLVDRIANVTLEPDYNFSRKNHRAYKGTSVELPPANHRRSQVKFMKPEPQQYATPNLDESSARTFTWLLARHLASSQSLVQRVPGWGGFQQLACEPDLCPVTVGYLPPIPESPNDMKVIYAEITRTLEIMNELDLPFIFIEADQAIYTKVIDAMFKLEHDGKEVFRKIVPRMGGFHIVMCMLKTINSLFKNFGFVQLLNSAGLGGMGTIKKCLQGGDVKEGIELYKKLFEALLRTKIEYMMNEGSFSINDELKQELNELINEINVEKVKTVQKHVNLGQFPEAQGDMGKMMDIFLEMVNLLLNYLHFLRVGNFEGALEAIFEFLAYVFRLNRNKYAKDLSFHYVHMRCLSNDNVQAYENLKDGGFSGSLTGLPHSRIPFDQIIEMTINRSCKDIGGLSQSTDNAGATERWTRTNHLMVGLREHLNKKIRRQSKTSQRELGVAKIKRDENKVRAIKDCLDKWIPDLWEPTKSITHIFSGLQATEEMKRDSLDIKPRGAALRDSFLGDLQTDRKKQVYYGTIKRQDIKLFSVKSKKKKITVASDECQSFSEVFALFDEKRLNLKMIMNWPVFSKPWSIVDEDLKSRDNAKSTFRNNLQSMAPIDSTHNVPSGITTTIVDGMRVVRLMRPSNVGGKTLRHWAIAFMKYVIELPGNILHLSFDDYDYAHNVPSKNRETVEVERDIRHLDQELPATSEWDDFLRNSKNKHKLLDILVDYILSVECKINKTVYVNRQSICFIKEENQPPQLFEQLHSTHREADQKIPLHVVFAGASADDGVCVVADDTDIYISLLYISPQVNSKLYFRQGKTKDKDGIVYHDVHSLAAHLGQDICNVLPAFHCLTGSDFTNPFFGRTKVTTFKKLLQNPMYCSKLETLGSESVNIDDVTDFIIHIIYNRPLHEKTPGESRHRMLLTARKRTKDGRKQYPSSKAIPPDQSSLKMKILRATFVAHCMMNCLNKMYVPLNPSSYGWKLNSLSVWEPVWYEGNALPDECNIEPTEDDEDIYDEVRLEPGPLDSDDEEDDDNDETECLISANESSDDEDNYDE